MCKVVRDVVAADFGQEVADKVRVQYGGSVKPENVAEYMACPDVDGALVGGASLDPESFLALLDFCKISLKYLRQTVPPLEVLAACLLLVKWRAKARSFYI